LINGLATGTGTETTPATFENPSYTDQADSTYTFTVNAFGTRTSITDPIDRTILMDRNVDDQLTMLTMPSEKFTLYEYDDRGNLQDVSGNVQAVHVRDSLTIDYDDTYDFPTTMTDDAVGTLTNIYDDDGNLTQSTLLNGAVYTFTYNARGQRTGMTVDGRTTTYAYNTSGNLETITDPSGGLWQFSYDTYGNIDGLTDPDGRETTAVYDNMNLMTELINGQGDTTSLTWSAALGSRDVAGYGPVAVITEITDGRDNTTTFDYDEMYRITEVTDALDNVKQFNYDPTGRLAAVIEPNGNIVEYTYNPAGQLTQKTLNGTDSITYTHNDETGLLTEMSTALCRIDIEYDWYDLVESITTAFLGPGGFEIPIDYLYRASNYQETQKTMTVGASSTYFGNEWFGDDGWLATDVFAGTWFWLNLEYDPSGRLTGWDESTTGQTAEFTLDDADRVTERTYSRSGADSGSVGLEYSTGGLIETITIPDGEHTYTYDDAGRLTAATHPTIDNPDESYTYDAAGNRRVAGSEGDFNYDIANRLLADSTCDYTYDESGNLRTRTNRATAEITTYTHNAENKLIRVDLPGGVVITFQYDPLGRLCHKDVDGTVTRYVYDRDQILAEFSETGTLRRQYVNGEQLDMSFGMKVGTLGTENNYYYLMDHIGSVLEVADDDGLFVQPYEYSAFGRVMNTPTLANSRQFAGMEYIAPAELYYVRNRFYDPQSGRFLQRDPEMMSYATTPYVYAGNNPMNIRDPYGLDPSRTQSPAGQTWDAFQDRIANPAIDSGISNGLGMLPDIGGAGTLYGTYQPCMDVIRIWRSDNPVEAGVRSWESKWWNAASPYVPGFLTLGGTFERREARVHRICGLSSGLRNFFAPQLSGSRFR